MGQQGVLAGASRSVRRVRGLAVRGEFGAWGREHSGGHRTHVISGSLCDLPLLGGFRSSEPGDRRGLCGSYCRRAREGGGSLNQ